MKRLAGVYQNQNQKPFYSAMDFFNRNFITFCSYKSQVQKLHNDFPKTVYYAFIGNIGLPNGASGKESAC